MKLDKSQRDLFRDYTPAPPFQPHSETSKDAAREIEPRAESLRRQVLDFLRQRGEEGGSDEEMQDALNMPGSTQRPRRVELVDAGLVVDSGSKRATRSGRLAVVWIAQRPEGSGV